MRNTLNHIAIIMDGNGRWAREQDLPRIAGHRQGAKVVNDIVTVARQESVTCLTLYAFSEQNWKRPDAEISALMELLGTFLKSQQTKILRNGIRLKSIGRVSRLPTHVQKTLRNIEEKSAKNDDMTLCLALSYGAKESLTDAMRKILLQIERGDISADDVDESLISQNLDTADLPPVDLLIRTGGEFRISNFLLWESAYAEFVYSDKMWPNYTGDDLKHAINIFMNRNRRYGDI